MTNKLKLNLIMGAKGKEEREENDFYATHPSVVEAFLKQLKKDKIKLRHPVWECACGKGHISETLYRNGYYVWSSDLIDRGYKHSFICDFLRTTAYDTEDFEGTILTNPPFNLADKFLEKAMEITKEGTQIIFFLKVQFLEGKARYKLFQKYPPKYIYLNSSRQYTAKNGDFEKYKHKPNFYIWCVWKKGFQGSPIVRWIP